MLRINGVVAESIVDGPGIRYTVFTQGCPHHCEGCHNPQTHDFAGGTLIEEQQILDEMAMDPLLQGITFSGGEPFCQPAALARIAKQVHARGQNVMTFTGYTYEKLKEMAKDDPDIDSLLKETDILLDGPFVLEERDLDLLFRGSRNQRMIRLENGEIRSIE